ncbi:MAG: hypothetical protein ACI91J_003292 [Yoonia sp.]|jgi:hypothetical protein
MKSNPSVLAVAVGMAAAGYLAGASHSLTTTPAPNINSRPWIPSDAEKFESHRQICNSAIQALGTNRHASADTMVLPIQIHASWMVLVSPLVVDPEGQVSTDDSRSQMVVLDMDGNPMQIFVGAEFSDIRRSTTHPEPDL